MAKRGRPKDTLRRNEAIDAAEAILRGEFADVRSAARDFRPARIGSEEGFRDFVRYVEEAYLELIEAKNVGSLRRFKPLAERTLNRQKQTRPRAKSLRQFLKSTKSN